MPDNALLVIDLQNDYFPGGAMELEGAEAAAAKAAAALAKFREQGRPIIHVRHVSVRPGSTFFLPGTPGAEIHAGVRPKPGEAVIEKNFPNSFRGTDLQKQLEGLGVKDLATRPTSATRSRCSPMPARRAPRNSPARQCPRARCMPRSSPP
jgi:nicotinamidase-related amidase